MESIAKNLGEMPPCIQVEGEAGMQVVLHEGSCPSLSTAKP